jgi:hypothetical protein
MIRRIWASKHRAIYITYLFNILFFSLKKKAILSGYTIIFINLKCVSNNSVSFYVFNYSTFMDQLGALKHPIIASLLTLVPEMNFGDEDKEISLGIGFSHVLLPVCSKSLTLLYMFPNNNWNILINLYCPNTHETFFRLTTKAAATTMLKMANVY